MLRLAAARRRRPRAAPGKPIVIVCSLDDLFLFLKKGKPVVHAPSKIYQANHRSDVNLSVRIRISESR